MLYTAGYFSPLRLAFMSDSQPLSTLPVPLPAAWQSQFAAYSWTAQTEGCSDASVYRLEAPGHDTVFIKTERMHANAELADEEIRLRWLAAQGVACPIVIDAHYQPERGWLLLSAVAGKDLYSASLPAHEKVKIMALALRDLHQLGVAHCPFDHNASQRVAHAKARMQAGLIELDNVDDENQGLSVEQLFQKLLATQPLQEDKVVTHGDACLPNFMAEDGVLTGYIDCGRLGVADRYQDLALAIRDISDDLGAEYVPLFLQHYGLAQLDTEKVAFYKLLDEFF